MIKRTFVPNQKFNKVDLMFYKQKFPQASLSFSNKVGSFSNTMTIETFKDLRPDQSLRSTLLNKRRKIINNALLNKRC
ncbi:hypothetical protein Lal_00012753 [Lupinus albus]|nr:hypothetical protein Lal_00012753 [Lupinus albus]